MKETRDEVRSIKRAFDILEILCREKDPKSLAYLHQALGLPKATLARILGTLEAGGFVERDSTQQKYYLGIKFFYYGYAVSERITEKRVVGPVMKRIRDTCLETVYIYILHKNRRLCVDCLAGKNDVRVITHIGDESPLYVGAAGKVILAHFSKEELEKYFQETELVPFTPGSIVSREPLEKELKLVRQQGYAVSLGEKISEVVSVSAPLIDAKGSVRASLTIAAPLERKPEVDNYISLVNAGAEEINKYGALKNL